VSRVFRGSGNKVCKATVENKLHRQDSGEMSLVPTNKSTATSILSANLALARVRPGPPKKEETTTNSNNTIQSSFNALSKYSKTTTSHNETNSSETKTGSEEAVLVKLNCVLIVRVVVTLASDEMLELGLNGRGFELALIWLKLLFLDKFDLVSDKSGMAGNKRKISFKFSD
jgi:hypothetical protein